MLSLESYNGCQLRSKDSLTLEVLSTARLVQVTRMISLCARTARRWGDFSQKSEKEKLLYIQPYTRYIGEPAITTNIRLPSTNIHCLHPFINLPTWFPTYKTLNP